jgi:hypothetical protein
MNLVAAGSRATPARWAVATGLGAFALFTALTGAYTWPLGLHLADVVPHDLGDPVLNTWLLWWNAHHLPFSPGWWDAPAFFPMKSALALTEHLAGLGWLTTPIQWIGGGPQLAYNLAFFLSFPLSALATAVLVHRLTGRRDAALVAGLAFAFSPYRGAQIAHVQVLSAYWMPVALLALHAYVDEGRARWLVLFAVAWLLQALSNGYYLFYFSVLVALWLLWFVRPARWRRGLAILAVWVAVALPLAPVLLRYQQVQQHLGLGRPITEIEAFSADISSLAAASAELALWGRLLPEGHAESKLFPGLTVIAILAAAGVVMWRRTRPARSPRRSIRLALLAAAILFALVAASPLVFGPWRVQIGALVVSVSRAHKPVTLAFVMLAALGFSGARFRSAFERRSSAVFYLLAGAFLYLCAFGPTPTLFGVPALYKAPYAWFVQFVPGFEGLRVPARFAMPATLCLAVGAAFGFVRLSASIRHRTRLATAAVALGILADGWPVPLELHDPPAAFVPASAVAPRASVLELPAGTTIPDVGALYRSISHGRPVVNGYSGYMPPHYHPLMLGLALHDQGVIDVLARSGPVQVFLDPTAEGGWKGFVEARGDARWLGRAGGREVYLVAQAPPEERRAYGPAVPIASVIATVNGGTAFQATDGRLRTSWRGLAPQDGTEQVDLDLGSPRPVGGVGLALGPFSPDVPSELAIETSEDGVTWLEGWRGVPASAFLAETIAHAIGGWAQFPLSSRTARYVRIRQLRRGVSPFAWSIAEVKVMAPAAM